jgi:hypothetical protein
MMNWSEEVFRVIIGILKKQGITQYNSYEEIKSGGSIPLANS